MRHNLLLAGLALTIVLGSLNHVQSQEKIKKPDQDKSQKADDKIRPADRDKDSNVHKLTIQNGQTRTVNYFSTTGSPSEDSALKELTRAENEATYAEDLNALRQQYLNTERAMESRRRQVQMALYGRSVETNTSATNKVSGYSPYLPADGVGAAVPAFNGGGFSTASPFANTGLSVLQRQANGGNTAAAIALTGGFGVGLNPTSFGLGFSPGVFGLGFSPLGSGFGGVGGNPGAFGLGFGTSPYGPYGLGVNPGDVDSFTLKTDTKVTNSLANGIGDEGRFKTAMVTMMASQATPEYASQAARNLSGALADVTAVMDEGRRLGRVVPATLQDKERVSVYLKNGKKIDGVLIGEDANWMKIWTRTADVRVRMDEVTRVDSVPVK